ncbi:hypothetical protein FE257_001806 [Aspergillus nanangensis]|uniref:Uncharacterized protein n=1 Tax=Aspergillus nanangensis TaxID=2582783 RepID=A0AAD4CDG2_ASPNN|nr:hypothetical protein FE257_001806 [Aspergillus nanangensis]
MQLLSYLILATAATAISATSTAADTAEPVPESPGNFSTRGLDRYYHMDCEDDRSHYDTDECRDAGWYCTEDGVIDNIEDDEPADCERYCDCLMIWVGPPAWMPCSDPSRCQ